MAIVFFRNLLGLDESDSIIHDQTAFQRIGAESKVFKFGMEPDESFDAAILGHSNLVLDQGPLTVAAFGHNPPERSTHFHISLLSLMGDNVGIPSARPSVTESAILVEQLHRLDTKDLTVLIGEDLDHAAVYEKRVELHTFPPTHVSGEGLSKSLPEGDGEKVLRRFIDDSVNLLAEQEFNQRRIDHGIAPINLAWPWGHGERQSVPNKALEIGYPWAVRANSLAIRGLARLSGLRTEKVPRELKGLLNEIQREPRSLTILDLGVVPLADEDREDWLRRLSDVGTELIEPLLEWHRDTKADLCFVATNRDRAGLVAFSASANERDHYPFDERSLTEKRVAEVSLRQLMR